MLLKPLKLGPSVDRLGSIFATQDSVSVLRPPGACVTQRPKFSFGPSQPRIDVTKHFQLDSRCQLIKDVYRYIVEFLDLLVQLSKLKVRQDLSLDLPKSLITRPKEECFPSCRAVVIKAYPTLANQQLVQFAVLGVVIQLVIHIICVLILTSLYCNYTSLRVNVLGRTSYIRPIVPFTNYLRSSNLYYKVGVVSRVFKDKANYLIIYQVLDFS